jgi:hypothetical protein
MNFRPPYVLILLTALAQAALAADRERNIFDDDWTPPKTTTEKPRVTRRDLPPVTTTPPPTDSTATPPRPNSTPTSEKTTVTPKPIKPPPATHRPVPPAAQLASVRRVLKDVFTEQLADRSIPARRKLATALLAQAEKSTDAPTDQFVLLAAAIDAAVEGSDLAAALRAADRMGELFDVDTLGVKSEAALKVAARKPAVADLAMPNTRAALALVDDLVKADDYAMASRVCASLQPLATNPALRSQFQQRQRDVNIARALADRFTNDLARLKQSPNDPAANLSAGRYLCFVKNEWDGGLRMLALSNDAVLKKLAAADLAPPKTPDDTARAADAWFDFAAKQSDPRSRAAITAHAATLYERVLPDLTGLRKTHVEQRLTDAAKVAATAAGVVYEVVVEALIDGSTTLHLTPDGLYWKSHGAAKPGLHNRRNEPTYVNGRAWMPRWSQPGGRGTDTSDTLPLSIGADLDLQAEVVACADQPGTTQLESRDPISSKVEGDEFVVNIPDGRAGSMWYRIRIHH